MIHAQLFPGALCPGLGSPLHACASRLPPPSLSTCSFICFFALQRQGHVSHWGQVSRGREEGCVCGGGWLGEWDVNAYGDSLEGYLTSRLFKRLLVSWNLTHKV